VALYPHSVSSTFIIYYLIIIVFFIFGEMNSLFKKHNASCTKTCAKFEEVC
jgi:hypothetical protein